MKDPLKFTRHGRLIIHFLDVGDPLKDFRLKRPSVGLLDTEKILKLLGIKKHSGGGPSGSFLEWVSNVF